MQSRKRLRSVAGEEAALERKPRGIVITLLVLPLAAEIELTGTADGLASDVWSQWPRIMSFGISFVVIGQFWLVHHRLLERLRRYDHGLLQVNLLCLLTVTFIPFPTALLGLASTNGDSFPVVFYAASLALTSSTFTGLWLYAVRRDLLHRSVGRAVIRDVTIRSFASSLCFIVSIGVAFLGLFPALVVWVVLAPLARNLSGSIAAKQR